MKSLASFVNVLNFLHSHLNYNRFSIFIAFYQKQPKIE